MIEAYAFHRPTGDQWLEIFGLHFKYMPAVKWDTGWFQPGPYLAIGIYHTQRDLSVRALQLSL